MTGRQLVGQVIEVTERPRLGYPIVVVEMDGVRWAWHAGSKPERDQLRAADPNPGDWIAVRADSFRFFSFGAGWSWVVEVERAERGGEAVKRPT